MHVMPEEPAGAVPPKAEYPTSIQPAMSAAMGGCVLMMRVGRFLQDVLYDRQVADDELRQHAMDCTLLMERAHFRFEQFGDPADRDEAVMWMHYRDRANRSLSPEWKAKREADIQESHFESLADQARLHAQRRGR